MARNFSRMTPEQLLQAMRDFAAYATAHLADTGLVAADVTPVTTGADDLEDLINAFSQAQDAAKAATAARNAGVAEELECAYDGIIGTLVGMATHPSTWVLTPAPRSPRHSPS